MGLNGLGETAHIVSGVLIPVLLQPKESESLFIVDLWALTMKKYCAYSALVLLLKKRGDPHELGKTV